jgi:hypothetical protein
MKIDDSLGDMGRALAKLSGFDTTIERVLFRTEAVVRGSIARHDDQVPRREKLAVLADSRIILTRNPLTEYTTEKMVLHIMSRIPLVMFRRWQTGCKSGGSPTFTPTNHR